MNEQHTEDVILVKSAINRILLLVSGVAMFSFSILSLFGYGNFEYWYAPDRFVVFRYSTEQIIQLTAMITGAFLGLCLMITALRSRCWTVIKRESLASVD